MNRPQYFSSFSQENKLVSNLTMMRGGIFSNFNWWIIVHVTESKNSSISKFCLTFAWFKPTKMTIKFSSEIFFSSIILQCRPFEYLSSRVRTSMGKTPPGFKYESMIREWFGLMILLIPLTLTVTRPLMPTPFAVVSANRTLKSWFHSSASLYWCCQLSTSFTIVKIPLKGRWGFAKESI